MSPREKVRALLDEQGIEWGSETNCDTYWYGQNGTFYRFTEYDDGRTSFTTCQWNLNPKQVLTAPIAATVGDKPKDNPRNYNPDGTPKIPNMNIGADPDWVDWVAGLKHEEPLSLKEAVEQLMFEIICFGGDMGPNDCGGEHCPDEGMVYTNDFINGWVNKIAATAGSRSCASCPEMDDPDSYISHLQAALEWHDEHVPRPTDPRNTCVVLEGKKPPEEVLFVGPDGVTHYRVVSE